MRIDEFHFDFRFAIELPGRWSFVAENQLDLLGAIGAGAAKGAQGLTELLQARVGLEDVCAARGALDAVQVRRER
jgi:hypothetical protein